MSPDDRRPVLVVAAFEEEIDHLLGHVLGSTRSRRGVWTSCEFEVEGMPVAVIRSGVGMVAAAAATEHGITAYNPRCVINFGSAGAQVRDILPGDVVIGERVVAYSTIQVLTSG